MCLCGCTCLHVFFKDHFWFPCRENVSIRLLTLSEVVSFGLPHNASVWILDKSDWRTHYSLYCGLSQRKGAEINWKNLFSFLLLSSQILTYWTVLFIRVTWDQSAPGLYFFPLEGFCCSHGSVRHPMTKKRANNLNSSLFLCKVCSVRFSNEMCLHSQNGVGY